MKKPLYIDLFAGCGGLSLGLHEAGWQGIFAIEKSKDAFETLQHNLIKKKNHFKWPSWLPKSHHDINDVLKNNKKELLELKGQVDMVVGGPPCQGFSTAGKRRESDERNRLIDSYIEFIKLVRPKVIFFENVRGFTIEFKTNKDKGRLYSEHVVKSLQALGYRVKGELVNFGEYGVPQKRTRFILVGIHKGISINSPEIASSFFSSLTINKRSFLKSKGLLLNPSLKDSISDLLKSHGEVESPDSKNFKAGVYSTSQSEYQKVMRRHSTHEIPDSHRFTNHNQHIISRFEFILKNAKRNTDLSNEIKEKYGIKKHTVIPLDGDSLSPTITTLPDDYIHYSEPRILTVREYARIQSFPDWFEFKGKYTTGGKMRTQEVPRYSQIGNAIPPLFGEQSGLILNKLIKNAG